MLSFLLLFCTASTLFTACPAVSAAVHPGKASKLTRREEQQPPGSALELAAPLAVVELAPVLRPGCRAQPQDFRCSEVRRAPCKLPSDPEDRGCGRQQKMCDYHLYHGSNNVSGDLVPCCEKRNLLTLLEYVDSVLCGRVEWGLAYGSLLAGVREHDLIDWDVDVDIVIHEEDRELANQLLIASKGDFDIQGLHPPVTRVYLSKQESVHLDIWWANTYGGCTWTDREWLSRAWLAKPFEGLCTIQGRTYPCPKQKTEVLDYLYGGTGYPGGGWRNTSGSSPDRCEDINKCDTKLHGFSCRAPPGTACNPDHDTGMVCVSAANETLLPDPVPPSALLEVPTDPGCYVLVPFACYGSPPGLPRANAWVRDAGDGEASERAHGSRELCELRAWQYDALCGVGNTKAAFVARPGLVERARLEFRRNCGLLALAALAAALAAALLWLGPGLAGRAAVCAEKSGI